MVETQTTSPSPPQDPGGVPAWFCLRTQPKHEHIAAARLGQEPDIEVFLPRIRYKRPTRQGSAWTTEALFPNYLFACFDLHTSLRKVHHAPGVRGVVHFGNRWPAVPGAVIEELRAALGTKQVHVLAAEPRTGDHALIAGGLFHGLEAVITRVMPGRERVAVLMNFLGRQTTVELRQNQLILEKEQAGFALRG